MGIPATVIPALGPWRDTHLLIEGPAALALGNCCLVRMALGQPRRFWDLPWEGLSISSPCGVPVLILPSGRLTVLKLPA